MWHTKDHESEEREDAHDNAKQKLSLHPKPYLVLRTAPKTNHVRLMLPGRDDAEKIINSRINHSKIKREYYDQNKRKDTAKDCRNRCQGIPKIGAYIKDG